MATLRTTLIAAIAVGLATTSAQAQGPAFATLTTSPTWWSGNGDHADLLLYYDSSAKSPLTLWGYYTVGFGNTAVPQGLGSCGTILPNGTLQLQPGGYCFSRSYRAGGAIIARIVATDGSSNLANFGPYIHASLEIRDANDNTLQHVELR